ncbi:MAG: hypothetical protein WBC60_09135 [Cognaticolwellia sp.]|jgi:hypothetical protein
MASKLDIKELESLFVTGLGDVTPGMKLEHTLFGLGEVEAIFEFIKSGDNTIRINFDNCGSKTLVPEYANLAVPKGNLFSVFGKLFKK